MLKIHHFNLKTKFHQFPKLSDYGHLKSQYAYLCDDGSLQLITDNSKEVCTWLRQPWPVVISTGWVWNRKHFQHKFIHCYYYCCRSDSVELSESINRWIHSSSGWEKAVKDILMADSLTPLKTDIQKPRDIFYNCS